MGPQRPRSPSATSAARPTVTFDNPTEWTFWGDYKVGDETGEPDAATGGTIAEGPLVGQEFGEVYHSTEVPAGESVSVDIEVTGDEPVDVSAWAKRGPEQRSFSEAAPVSVTPCEQEPTEPPVTTDPATPPGTTDPTTDPSETDESTTEPTDTNNCDVDGDEAEDDGSAPTPAPQPGDLSVTG
jgi:hypothetical protein